jgi:hypothetical protein
VFKANALLDRINEFSLIWARARTILINILCGIDHRRRLTRLESATHRMAAKALYVGFQIEMGAQLFGPPSALAFLDFPD